MTDEFTCPKCYEYGVIPYAPIAIVNNPALTYYRSGTYNQSLFVICDCGAETEHDFSGVLEKLTPEQAQAWAKERLL